MKFTTSQNTNAPTVFVMGKDEGGPMNEDQNITFFKRKIIQLEIKDGYAHAVCNDGTIWSSWFGMPSDRDTAMKWNEWEKMPLPEIPQD